MRMNGRTNQPLRNGIKHGRAPTLEGSTIEERRKRGTSLIQRVRGRRSWSKYECHSTPQGPRQGVWERKVQQRPNSQADTMETVILHMHDLQSMYYEAVGGTIIDVS